MKKTPLYEKTVQSGAKIVDFHGWEMPLQYCGILEESKKTRTHMGICDVSHMAQVRVTGKGALDFLQRLTPNNVASLCPGEIQYNLFLNEQGGIIDDFMLYHCGRSFLCVVNAANKEKDLKWLLAHCPVDMDITDESDQTALISLQGPQAHLVMKRVFGESLIEEMGYMKFNEMIFKNRNCLISRSGYTGEDGFEIYVDYQAAGTLWDEILRNGEPHGLICVGLGARDVLRIEAGYCLWGNDIDESTNPYEAGLHWVVKLDKKDFIGKEKLRQIRAEGITRARIGFIMEDRGVPRQGYQLCDEQGNVIGKVTSGTYSAYLEKFIGMGYVSSDHTAFGHIQVSIRDRLYRANIAGLPFVPFRHKSNKAQTYGAIK
ncbi:MAG: glycine cleavage system aminomethyltransferase GcvT [Candidatus Omnitrophica bacterium]|nr:glycine cleavage system aminomethyltransferase GcvT [Candidatus Omnitrophota bacterium]